jgi:O-antigen/teichoic acid export membrane protein
MNKMVDKVLRGESLKMRALRMSGLGGIDKGGGAFLRLIGNIILARLLFPEAFGLVALVAVVKGAAELFSDVGIKEALIRHPRADERIFRDTAWTLQILRGLVLAGITVALAGPFAALYGEEILADLVPVAALSFVIFGFNSTKIANSERHLRVGRLTVISIAARSVGLVAMVGLAWATGSVWSLIIGNLMGNLTRCILSHTYLPGALDRPRLERAAIWQIFDLGRFLLVSTAATFVSKQANVMILGLFLALGSLGQFNMALALAALPKGFGSASFKKALLSLFANRPIDGTETRARSRQLARRVAALSGGMLIIGFAFVAPPVINLLYDERYALVAPMALLLTLAYLPGLLQSGYGASILARGEGKTVMYTALLKAGGQVAGISLGVLAGGVVGAIIGSAIGRFAPLFVVIPAQRRVGEWDRSFDIFWSLCVCVVAAGVCWLYWPQVELLLEANADSVTMPWNKEP